MSGALDIHVFDMPLGAFLGATEVPLAKVPISGGGITILEAYLVGPAAGTVVGGLLVTMSGTVTGGTPAINGTIGTFAGTIVAAAGIVHKLTITDSWVAGDEWIGMDETSGTVPAGTFITVSYVVGKGTPT